MARPRFRWRAGRSIRAILSKAKYRNERAGALIPLPTRNGDRMRKHLGWIVVAAFAGAALFLGGAWMLSGGGGLPEILARYSGFNFPFCSSQLSGEQASRDIAWEGGERVSINVPATVHYRPGADGAVKVVGDKALISHVRIDQGDISLDCRPGRLKASLDITLPGRSFRTFSLAG